MTREQLAQELCDVINIVTDDIACRDAFDLASTAIIIAIQKLDAQFKIEADCQFREAIIDYLTMRVLS